MLRFAFLLVPVVGLAIAAPPADNHATGPFPPPKTLGPVETYGANVQRAMTLMAASTPLKRNTVRVLFYGQSITYADWTRVVGERLRRRYPLTDFAIENRAVLGFSAEYLVKTAEADLYPFYPDLVVFHDYGSPTDYEAIIRRVRERTTADILMATDHVAPLLGERTDEETDPAKLIAPRSPLEPAAPWRNFVFLPGIAKKYDTGLADVRGLWKRYLADHRLKPSALLFDDLHLNAHGNYLMAEIITAQLRYRPELPDDGWKDRVKTYTVGPEGDVTWKGGRLVLPFEGNRVELVCGEGGATAPPAAVRIDGKKPSAFPELYAHTRAEMVSAHSPAPPLLRVGAANPRVIETWTLRFTGPGPDRKGVTFKLSGSVTGDDGEGETGKRFLSKSGRVVIDPDDFFFGLGHQQPADASARPVVIRWSVVPLFADQFALPAARNPFGETVVTVAQGLPNGKHTLELTGTPDTPLAAIRVYRPPLPTP